MDCIRNVLRRLGLLAHEEFDDIVSGFHKAIAKLDALVERKQQAAFDARVAAERAAQEEAAAHEARAAADATANALRNIVTPPNAG